MTLSLRQDQGTDLGSQMLVLSASAVKASKEESCRQVDSFDSGSGRRLLGFASSGILF